MDITGILDGQIHLEGQTLPTVREIIERHFVASAGGNEAIGRLTAAQYVRYLEELARGAPAGTTGSTKAAEGDQPGKTTADAASSQDADGARPAGARIGNDAEALLKSFGIPVGADGRIDVMGALAGAMTPDGSKTPLGTLFGTVMRGIGEASKPRP